MTNKPPQQEVWWYILSPTTNKPAYTKAKLYMDARANFGGGMGCHPQQVTDPTVIELLDQKEGKKTS